MAHRHSYPMMDKRYAPAPLRLFKTRDTRPLNTLSNCTNKDCGHDLSRFDLAPLNCPVCGKKTSTAPPLPPAGPGWEVDYRNSGGLITDEHPKPEMEVKMKGYGDGAEADGDVFSGNARIGFRMDNWTCQEGEIRGTKARIEKWREHCGDEECRGYFIDDDEAIQHPRSGWDTQEGWIRGRRGRNVFSIGSALSRQTSKR